ncbi:hypothetical protein SBV1_1240002 [Verrucomicrobia bacterium]|nr:hypothetical protein SBV1_1240002 [Verrucomicrobiota bacterium]
MDGKAGKGTGSRSPIRVVWKDVLEPHARARLRHHRGDSVAPDLVVLGFFVCPRRFRRLVRLDQHEAGGLILALDEIEPGNAGFLEAFSGIGQRGGFKSLKALRLDLNMNVDDQHKAPNA